MEKLVETNLFVGGPIDGRRMPVHPDSYHVDVPVSRAFSVCYLAEFLAVTQNVTFKFWRFEDMTRQDAIQRLFDSYKPIEAAK